jgi:hypothetical protein
MPNTPAEQEVKDGVCQMQHGPILHIIKQLPRNQKNSVRHRCAGCAYRKGFNDGVEAAFQKLKDAAIGSIDAP